MAHSTGVDVLGIRRGQHACLLYDGKDDPLATVAPFVAAGLEARERCLYVVGEQDPERIQRSLEAVGIDVAGRLASGALVLVSHWEVSFPEGEFDPAAMIGFVRQAITQCLKDGFTGLRVVAEMTWALRMGVGANRLIHYEALGNHLYPDEPLVAVCMYDRSRFPAAVCRDAIRVHPWVSAGGAAYENLYYEPPEAVMNGMAAEARVDWMLAQLERMRQAEAQRLELLSARIARAEAEAEARSRDALLSTLAHELRTPLTSMLMYTQTALRGMDRTPAADANSLRRNLEVVVRQAMRQARLIEQVLSAARLAEGQFLLEPGPCDLAALVQEVAEMTRTVAPEHTVVVRAPDKVDLVADPLRLEQVLVNLLDNARKYSPPGTPIEIGVIPEPDAVVVAVRDHGAGIPAEEHERIFERFRRLRTDQNGLGLGLHISRDIVRKHGGDLQVELPPDGGTRFVVRLPLADARRVATG
jgi:signal transduction histidine kinase